MIRLILACVLLSAPVFAVYRVDGQGNVISYNPVTGASKGKSKKEKLEISKDFRKIKKSW